MSRKLINLSPDLRKLEDDGFDLEVKSAHLLVHGVPYVTSRKEIAYGTLVAKLDLAGERTDVPENHVIHFIGEHPCQKDGSQITAIHNASQTKDLGNGLVINHTFSSRLPDRKYRDYHEKVTQYVKILMHEARAIDPNVQVMSSGVRESTEPDSVFHYPDTNSSRAEIGAISAKLGNLKIAIVGSGGTGSYVLDFVSKTHIREIHLFDGDVLLNHNAFRAPGAASLEILREKPKKVAYLHAIYSKMHKGVVAHDYRLDSSNVEELLGMDFVFVCVDKPAAKKVIIDKLIERHVPFIDVGIGVSVINDALTGSARVTTCTKDKYDHYEKRISFSEEGENDYSMNIQIAELNALNAALAVIKWKKCYGYYHDLEKEHHSSYSINVNKILNDEIIP